MDIKSPEDRSKNMAAIKNKNTKPETKLRKALFKASLRFRINNKLPGKPDIVFPKKRLVIFVDGCFWHRCPICYREPDNNKEFWQKKIASNVKRDITVSETLSKEGWTVLRYWEHEIKKDLERVVAEITKTVKGQHIEPLSYKQSNDIKPLVAETKAQYNNPSKRKK